MDIRTRLMTDRRYLIKSLLRLYRRQTETERRSQSTSVFNGVGFNKYDAKFGCSLAEQVLSGRYLSAKQIKSAQNMLKKYTRQLAQYQD